MENQFELGPLVGKIRKRRLVGFDGDFLQLQTFENANLINHRHLIAVKVFGGGWR